MSVKLASKAMFRRMADTIMRASGADDTFVSFHDAEDSTLRFANNQVVQNVSVRAPSVSVRVAFGQRSGGATTNRLDDASLRRVVAQAERIARVTPDDPEYLSPLPPQRYGDWTTFRDATAAVSPAELAARTKPVIDRCVDAGLVGAGIMTTSVSGRGVAASSGLFGYEQASEARFSLTATGEDSSGWTFNAHRDINALDVGERTRRAVDKAVMSRGPREVPAGFYPVILEPAAVAGVFGPMFWSAGAKSYFKGDSPFAGKLGSIILDPRLSVVTDPAHEDLLGSRFGGSGLASRGEAWIERGVLKQLYYDRFTAKEHGVAPNSFPSTPVMTFDGPTVATVDELVAQTDRAILVTNFWYIRFVNRRDLTLTGMTRDGTFLVEDGKIVAGVKNFRFHESPLRCFAQVDVATPPKESITLERGKMLLPAVRLPAFHFSSVTRF